MYRLIVNRPTSRRWYKFRLKHQEDFDSRGVRRVCKGRIHFWLQKKKAIHVDGKSILERLSLTILYIKTPGVSILKSTPQKNVFINFVVELMEPNHSYNSACGLAHPPPPHRYSRKYILVEKVWICTHLLTILFFTIIYLG